MTNRKTWTLLGPDNQFYISQVPGELGGHRKGKVYGRMDCRSALSAIARGGYVQHRVFFLNASDAVAAGYRPCAVCMPGAYAAWKAGQQPFRPAISQRGQND
jgi:hypothetical protein